MGAIKIIIVDDHALFRVGERAVITKDLPNATILGDYSSGEELLVHLNSGVLPDLVLLDIIMPNMTGIEVAGILKNDYPDVKIIMLSSEVETNTVQELLDIGINGYLSKMAVNEDLVNAISAVMTGNLYYGRDIAKIMYDIHLSKSGEVNKQLCKKTAKYQELTNREIEIVKLYCDGFTAKEIAEKLFVSERTVSNHKANIMQKLGFQNTVDLVKYAIQEKIIVL